ncbi:MAG: toll/interleukin-1 receptor domain-containing protein [Actinobacteria bacterium]|nr:toll/interleukin-1 receptor domain-containing protein [Actinomycetota bacterium]
MADVFISYSSLDRERIRVLAEALEGEGFSVWWDQDIPPGSDYMSYIFSELQTAPCVIVAWSATSVASHYVRSEAETARVRHALVPAMLEMVPIPPPFNLLNAVELMDWNGDLDHSAWKRLLIGVRRRIETAPETQPPPPPPPPPREEEKKKDPEPEPEPDPDRYQPALPVSGGAAGFLAEADDVKRKAHSHLGVHHWMLALLDRHHGMVERLVPGLDHRSLRTQIHTRIHREEDYGEPLSADDVLERADRLAAERGAEQIWERDVAAAILEEGKGLIEG